MGNTWPSSMGPVAGLIRFFVWPKVKRSFVVSCSGVWRGLFLFVGFGLVWFVFVCFFFGWRRHR